MAADEDDDPVTAEYSVYLTPSAADATDQVYLLQYPNRVRNRPYNAHHGAAPDAVRMKPESGYLELDIPLNTSHNFNKYQGLKWGDAVTTGKEVQNGTSTYGLAGGFAGAKPRTAGRVALKDRADRDTQITHDLATFPEAESEDRVMHKQTLGGQIVRHDAPAEAGKPLYFVGAFRDDQLHLTRVHGTVQMRPQFHHLDAEEQRQRLAASRAAALEQEPRAQGDPKSILMKNKSAEESAKDRLEDRTRKLLEAAEAEEWVRMEYVDEDLEQAYDTFHERMFVPDVASVPKLESTMDDEQFLDALGAPRRESPTRRRKRPTKRRSIEDDGAADGATDDEGGHGGG